MPFVLRRISPPYSASPWGAYGYKPEHDVVRAPMTVETRASSLDQMAINFVDVTAEGGTLVVVWDNQAGSLPFKVAK